MSTATRTRVGWIDQLRGFAVALMVLDHVLVQVSPDHVLRFTATRLALPLFMVTAAAVWRPPTRRRVVRLLAAAAAETVLVALLGMAQPGIVTIFALVTVCGLGSLPARSTFPTGPLLVVGLVQALYVPVEWAGYEPGLVLAWWCVGRLAFDQFAGLGDRLPAWLATVGRRPLTWYVGHLLVLVVVFA